MHVHLYVLCVHLYQKIRNRVSVIPNRSHTHTLSDQPQRHTLQSPQCISLIRYSSLFFFSFLILSCMRFIVCLSVCLSLSLSLSISLSLSLHSSDLPSLEIFGQFLVCCLLQLPYRIYMQIFLTFSFPIVLCMC